MAVLLAACQSPPAELDVAAGFPVSRDCEGDTQITGAPNLPKNVVFLMADGMGPMQLLAAEIHNGRSLAITSQLAGPVYLNTDSVTTDRTEDADTAPTDSAAAATALASGVRTLNGKVGVDADLNPIEILGEIARAEGKAVGIVTTTFVYDASPAGFIAHSETRSDSATIVTSAIEGVAPEVWFGAGQGVFDDSDDGALAAAAEAAGYTILRTAEELDAWNPASTPLVIGIFEEADPPVPGVYNWGLTPVVLRTADTPDPRLTTLTARALDGIAGDPDGFLLFVETEHTDSMGHIALSSMEISVEGIPLEIIELDDTLQVVLDWVAANSSFDETLVVVGADHETGGYTFDGGDPATAMFPASPLHTRTPVPFYAIGPGSENLASMCRISDPFLLFTGRLTAP